MPKNKKTTKTRKRTKMKDLPDAERDLTTAEKKAVKGGVSNVVNPGTIRPFIMVPDPNLPGGNNPVGH